MPKEESQGCVHEIRMIAGEHLGIQPSIFRLELLKGYKESFLKIDHAFMEMSCLHL
jgi:hypothetical protein